MASRYLSCITGRSIVCGSDGQVQVNGPGNNCANEFNAIQDCINAAISRSQRGDTNMPPPGNGR